MTNAHGEKDKFETLCYVRADLSTAPCETERTAAGIMCYKRDAVVVLLVGLTELKAQVSWIDSKTVRARLIPQPRVHLFTLPNVRVRIFRGQREGL